eukprot:15465992-Alexandrium_andersonii.AAC.1
MHMCASTRSHTLARGCGMSAGHPSTQHVQNRIGQPHTRSATTARNVCATMNDLTPNKVMARS